MRTLAVTEKVAGRKATRNFSVRVTGTRLEATIHESSQERPVGIRTPP